VRVFLFVKTNKYLKRGYYKMDIFKKFTLLTFALVSVSAFADAPGDEVESNNTSSDDVVESTVASEDTASSSMNAAVDEGDGDVENVVVTG
jgi:hypothetical protein